MMHKVRTNRFHRTGRFLTILHHPPRKYSNESLDTWKNMKFVSKFSYYNYSNVFWTKLYNISLQVAPYFYYKEIHTTWREGANRGTWAKNQYQLTRYFTFWTKIWIEKYGHFHRKIKIMIWATSKLYMINDLTIMVKLRTLRDCKYVYTCKWFSGYGPMAGSCEHGSSTFQFHKRRGIFWPDQLLLYSQVLCSSCCDVLT